MDESGGPVDEGGGGRPAFGVDAPGVPVGLGLGAAAAAVAAGGAGRAGWGPGAVVWFAAVAVFLALNVACYLYATRRGKHRAWARLLDGSGWRGDERVLDLGCGRGAVLLAAAERLPAGFVVGLDRWDRHDQSGNAPGVTRRNAGLAGVAGRVAVGTADGRALPVADARVDAVVSSLVLHNLHDAGDRRRVLAEAARVLRPGGRLVVADIAHLGEYRAVLEDLGLSAVEQRTLGPGTWYGNPFVRLGVVTATR